MKHVDTLEGLHVAGALVTIGAFDGVHLGHQKLIGGLVGAARAAGLPGAVVTFHPHPAVVLRGIAAPYSLTAPEERARLFGQMGIDWVITLPFTRALAEESAGDFIGRLHSALGLRELWVGYDFALGKGRQGDIPFLRRLGETLGYHVRVTEQVALGERSVSSSQIRALLAEGEVRAAGALLGRRYGFSGPVVHGDGRGRSIGIPTANVQPWEGQLLPRTGVYATWAEVGGERLPAVTNIGFRPTFDNPIPAPRVEALLLDFDQDLYGRAVRLEFVEYLRPEQRFDSVEQLLKQIAADRRQAREVLDHDR